MSAVILLVSQCASFVFQCARREGRATLKARPHMRRYSHHDGALLGGMPIHAAQVMQPLPPPPPDPVRSLLGPHQDVPNLRPVSLTGPGHWQTCMLNTSSTLGRRGTMQEIRGPMRRVAACIANLLHGLNAR